MADPNDQIEHDHNSDGIDRRGFLKCMAWAGTGIVCLFAGGVLKSYGLSQLTDHAAMVAGADFSFVQISDSHIGFSKDANKDVVGTLRAAVDKINALPNAPDFMLHTGDISHLSQPDEFDTVDQMLKSAKTSKVFYVPGEHDVLNDGGKQYLSRYGGGATGGGWYSFDQKGVHFIGLVNVLNLKAGGLGDLGAEQLDWVKRDVQNLKSSTPIVVFAHIPLWSVYPEWGWGTDDSAQLLSYLKRFGSVTVLNGHIHQTLQKVEGNVTFHTAMSTAFPQPQPGTEPNPGPMRVPPDMLRSVLGVTEVNYVQGTHSLAIVDSPLSAANSVPNKPASTATIGIDNFRFAPAITTVSAGATVTWVNHDDVPHTIISADRQFTSPTLDTDGRFSYVFAKPGKYVYSCGIHPSMTAQVIVL